MYILCYYTLLFYFLNYIYVSKVIILNYLVLLIFPNVMSVWYLHEKFALADISLSTPCFAYPRR